MGLTYRNSEGSLLPTFEELRQSAGFVLYETVINATMTSAIVLRIDEPRDRVYVYINGVS